MELLLASSSPRDSSYLHFLSAPFSISSVHFLFPISLAPFLWFHFFCWFMSISLPIHHPFLFGGISHFFFVVAISPVSISPVPHPRAPPCPKPGRSVGVDFGRGFLGKGNTEHFGPPSPFVTQTTPPPGSLGGIALRQGQSRAARSGERTHEEGPGWAALRLIYNFGCGLGLSGQPCTYSLAEKGRRHAPHCDTYSGWHF